MFRTRFNGNLNILLNELVLELYYRSNDMIVIFSSKPEKIETKPKNIEIKED